MNLPLHQLLPTPPVPLYVQTIDATGTVLCSASPSTSTSTGYSSSSSSSYNASTSTDTAGSGIYIHTIWPRPSTVCASVNYNGSAKLVVPYGKSNLLWIVPNVTTRSDTKGKSRALATTTTTITTFEANQGILELYDASENTKILELQYREPVLGIKCRKDWLVVILKRRVLLYSIRLGGQIPREQAVVKQGEWETCNNPLGLAVLSTNDGPSNLAFPGRQTGHVQLVSLPVPEPGSIRSTTTSSSSKSPPYAIIHIFLAHTSPLRTLHLSSTGSLLVTSSSKGTILRIFDTESKALLRELRRGTDQADIWDVAIADPLRGGKIAAVSDKGTIHVWLTGNLFLPISSTKVRSTSDRQNNPGDSRYGAAATAGKGFKLLQPYLPAYFSSTWSDLTWRIPITQPAPPSTASLISAAGGLAGLAGVTPNPSTTTSLPSPGDWREIDIAQCIWVSAQPPSSSKRKGRAEDRKNHSTGNTRNQDETDQELLVITRSGAWYRLSTTPVTVPGHEDSERSSPSSAAKKPSTHTTTTSRKSSLSTHVKDEEHHANASKKCTMLEYRRLIYPGDIDAGWSSSDEE